MVHYATALIPQAAGAHSSGCIAGLPAEVGGVGKRDSPGGSDGRELRNEAAVSLHIRSCAAQRSTSWLNHAGGCRQFAGFGFADQVEVAVLIHRDRGGVRIAAAGNRALEIQVAEESGIEQVGAGGIEYRHESELGVAPDGLAATDHRFDGGGKARWKRIIGQFVGANIGLNAGHVGATGAVYGNGPSLRPTPVSAEKRRVRQGGSRGIQLGHKYVPVLGVAV